MKLKKGFLLREIAGQKVVVPVSPSLDRNMMITLNTTGCALWKALESGADMPQLVETLTNRFDVDAETAAAHAAIFVENLRSNDLLQE